MELELEGLRELNADDKALVDAHAIRDDEVDWEQLSLSHIDQEQLHPTVVESNTNDASHEMPQELQRVDRPPSVVEQAEMTPHASNHLADRPPLLMVQRAEMTSGKQPSG